MHGVTRPTQRPVPIMRLAKVPESTLSRGPIKPEWSANWGEADLAPLRGQDSSVRSAMFIAMRIQKLVLKLR